MRKSSEEVMLKYKEARVRDSKDKGWQVQRPWACSMCLKAEAHVADQRKWQLSGRKGADGGESALKARSSGYSCSEAAAARLWAGGRV